MADVDSLSAPEASEEPVAAPKRRRGRPRKTESAVQEKITEQPQPTGTANTEEKTKRRRGRPRKSEIKGDNKPDASPMMDGSEPASASSADGEPVVAPKRRRGRPRKVDVEASADVSAKGSASQPKSAQEPQQETISDSGDGEHGIGEVKPRRRRGRPRKNETVDAETNRLIVQAASSHSEKAPQPTTSAEDTTTKGALVAPQILEESAGDSSEISAPRIRRRYTTSAHGDSQQQSKNDPHDVRESSRDRRQNTNQRTSKRRQQTPVEPSLTREMLADMKVAELRAKAAELNLEYLGIRKPDLIEMIYYAAAANEGFRSVEGILQIGPEGYGWVRTGNYMEGDDDAFVHQQIIRHLGLRQGDKIVGTVSPGRANSKYPPLQRVLEVNGGLVENLKSRPRFRDLTPIFPNEPLKLEHGKNSITGRAIDLVAPIGKGQRGLIVSPPKAGKTTILKKICQSISANNPEVHLFCLLVDERPEEVT
ncbi:transcription termination factor Rho, partial [Lancefieldella rimae]|uniref:transcription termination factor Rho n=1 Tax=Lancefieldella rimae TaxID=1383 RepID=UPI003A9253BD